MQQQTTSSRSFHTSMKGNLVSPHPKFMLPVKGMVGCELHKVVKGKGRGKFKGFKHETPKHKEQESTPAGNHYGSSSRYNDHHSVKGTLQYLGNGKFNGELRRDILDVFIRAGKEEIYILFFSILLSYDQIARW